jgi:transmembrane sensor
VSGRDDEQRRIEAEAAEWVVRLEAGRLDGAERRRLEAWCRRSPAHERALAYARRTWAELGAVEPPAYTTPTSAAADDPTAGRRTPGSQGRPKRRLGLGLAASLLLAGALGAVSALDPVTALRADHTTRVGEVREITLPDGSTVQLDTDTALAVDFAGPARSVTVLDGAAAFSVAANGDAGPFVVRAAGGSARALGTEFVVRAAGDRAQVKVLADRVRITAGQGADAPSKVLSSGQAVDYGGADGRLGAVRAIDPRRVATWREGRLVFDDVPLAAAVAEINRYRGGRVAVLDSTLAERRVSGVFRIADLDRAPRRIARELGARTTSVPFLTVLH